MSGEYGELAQHTTAVHSKVPRSGARASLSALPAGDAVWGGLPRRVGSRFGTNLAVRF